MFVLIILIFLHGCFCRHPTLEELDDAAETCIGRYNATFEEFEVILNFTSPQTYTESCLYACFYERLGIMYKNNEVNATLLEMLLDPEYGKQIQQKESIEIYTSCAKILKPSTEYCQRAKIFVTCSHDRIMEVRRWALRE